jgi:hypothetical protein
MASDAAGYHAAHETYTGEGTQSLLVTDTIDDASTSVFWNNNDDTKQIIHGSSLTELLTSGASKNASWGGFQTFSIDPETDCIGDLFLSITLNLDTPDTPLDSDLNPKTITTMLQKPSPRDAINDPSKLEPIGWYKRGIKNGDTLPEAGYIGIPNGWLHLKTDANDLSSGFRYVGTGMDAVDSYGLPIDAIELPGMTGIHPDSSPRAQAWEDIQDVLKKDAELFKVNDFICTDTYLDPSDNKRVIHQRGKDVGIGEYLIQDQGRTATNSYDVNGDYIRSVDRARSFRISENFYHNGRRNNFVDEYNVPTETDDNTWTLSTLFNDEKLLPITSIGMGGAFLSEQYVSETLQISAIFPSSVTLADIQANEASYISRLFTTMSRTVDQFVYPEWTGSITSAIVNIPERHWGWYVFDKYVTNTAEFYKASDWYSTSSTDYLGRQGNWVPTSTLSFDNPLNPDIIATLTLTADPDELLVEAFWLSGREGASVMDVVYAKYLNATMSCHKMEEPFLNWPGNVSESRNNISRGDAETKPGVPSLNRRDDSDLKFTTERQWNLPVNDLLYQTRSSWENYPGFTSYPGRKLITCTKKSSLDAFGQTVDFLVFDFFKPHSLTAANLGPPRDITPEEMNKYISSTRSILTGINNEHLRTLSTISTHDGFRDQNRRGGDIEYTDSNFQFGRAMAISGDGTTIVIGAPAESLATTEEGTIEVWRWQNEYILDSVPMYDNAEPWRYATRTKHWVKQQSSMSGDGKFRGQFPGDMYGSSVAINADGSKIVVGCPGAQGANGEADGGQVQVLVRDGWVYNVGGDQYDVAKWGAGTMLGEGVQIYGGGTGDRMGGEKSLAINASGNTIAVGSALSDRNGADSGSVFVYEFIPPVWTQRTVIDGEAAGDRASFVAMDTTGDIVAVGAPYHVGSIVVEEGVNIGAGGGQVRVWYWDRTQSPEIWVQRGSDIESTSSSHSQVGRSVAMNSDGDIVAFGGYKNIQGSVTGFVRIVKWTETLGTWEQMGSDIEGEEPGDNSGHSVSLSATGVTVSIGAPQNSIQGAPTGHVRIWDLCEGTWLKRGSDISGVGPGENFGNSVALSSDGNMVVVGAPEAGNSEGCVRVYTSPGIPITQTVYAEEFTLSQTLVGDTNDYMGYSLSFNRDGTKLVTGAPRGYSDAVPVKKTRTRDPAAENAGWAMGNDADAYNTAWHHLPVHGLEGKSRPEYLIVQNSDINSTEEAKEANVRYLESFGGHFHDTYDGAIPGWQDFGSDAGRGQRSRRLRMASGCVYLYELNMSTSPGYTAALWSRTLELDVDSGERNPTDQKSWPGATGKYGQCQGTADCLGVSVAMDGMGNTIIAGAPFMSTIGKVQEKIDWYPGGGMTAAYSIHAEGETAVIEDGDPVSSVLLADTTLRSHIRETEEEVGRSYVFNLDTYIYGTPSEQLPIKDPTAKNMLMVDAYNMVNDAQRRLNHDITDFIDLPEPGQPIKWDKQFTSVPIGANYPPLRGDYQAPEWADSDLTSNVKFPLLNVIKKIEILVDEKVWQTINHSDLLAIYSTEMTESSYKTIATNSSGRLRNDGTRQANTGGRWIPGKKYDLTIPIPGFTSGVSPRFNNFTKNDENGFLAGLTDSSNFKVRVYYNDLQNVWNTNNVSAMQGYRAPIYNVPHETVKIEDGVDSSGNNSSLVSRGARYSVTGTSSGTGLYVTNVPEPWTPGITFNTKMYGQKIIMNRDELKQLKNTPDGISKKIIKSENANNVFNRVLYNKPINIELDYISLYSSHLIINLKYINPYNSPYLKTAQLFLNSKPFAKLDQGLMRGISNKSLGLYANEYNIDNISLDPSGGNYVFPLANKAFGGSSIQFSSFDTIRLELIFESAELKDNNGLLADIVDINVTVRGLSKITYKNGVSSISD